MTDNLTKYGTAPVALRNHLGLSTSGSCMFQYRGYQIVLDGVVGSIWAPEGHFVSYTDPTIGGMFQAVTMIDEAISKDWA
jgi:hypothetical protein